MITVNGVIYQDSVNGYSTIGNKEETEIDRNAVGGAILHTIIFESFVDIYDEKKVVNSIGNRAFRRCFDIENVVIPNTITIISDYAFDQCHNLISFNFESQPKLKYIGFSAFYNTSLKLLTIPESVTFFDNYCFCAMRCLDSLIYYGKFPSQKKLFDYRKKIEYPTPPNVSIFVSLEYESEKFGERNVTSRIVNNFKTYSICRESRSIMFECFILPFLMIK